MRRRGFTLSEVVIGACLLILAILALSGLMELADRWYKGLPLFTVGVDHNKRSVEREILAEIKALRQDFKALQSEISRLHTEAARSRKVEQGGH